MEGAVICQRMGHINSFLAAISSGGSLLLTNLQISSASAMHIPLKIAASPGGRNPCGCPAGS